MSEEVKTLSVLYRDIPAKEMYRIADDPHSSVLDLIDVFAERDRLIEQNRELLEALKGMIVAYDDGVQPEWALPYIHAAHAAIRKATGEEA